MSLEAHLDHLIDRPAAIARRIAAILAGDTSAMFARGSGGAKSSKGKGKAGKEKGKKGKGGQSASSGGACCKVEGGKFGPGNNYGSLNRGSAKVAANRAGRVAGKAAAKAAGPARAGIAGLVGRSRQAAAKGGQVKAARDKETAVAAQKQARNQKARERRAAKKADGKAPAAPSKAESIKSARDAAKATKGERLQAAVNRASNKGGKLYIDAAKLRTEANRLRAGVTDGYGNRGKFSSMTQKALREADALDAKASGLEKRASILGRRGAKLEDVRVAASKRPSTTSDRAPALRRMTDRSRVASGKAGAENARRTREAAKPTRPDRGSREDRLIRLQQKGNKISERRYKEYRALETRRDELTAKIRATPDKNQKTFQKLMRQRDEVDIALGKPSTASARQSNRMDRINREVNKDIDAKARTAASTPKGIGGREPDLRGVAPAGKTPAASRAIAGRATAIAQVVRKSREAAQGAKLVAGGRSSAAVAAAKSSALKALGPAPPVATVGGRADAATIAWRTQKAGIEATHVPPVPPPPPAVRARPISDPARLRAESAAMDRAIAQAPGARDNFVPVAAVRNAMPHLSRTEFDAVLNARRDRGEVGLDSHQGDTRPLSEPEKAGAVREGGSVLAWLSRRDRGGEGGRATAFSAMVRRSREAAQGAKLVANRRAAAGSPAASAPVAITKGARFVHANGKTYQFTQAGTRTYSDGRQYAEYRSIRDDRPFGPVRDVEVGKIREIHGPGGTARVTTPTKKSRRAS